MSFDYNYTQNYTVIPTRAYRYVPIDTPLITPIDLIDLKSQVKIDWYDQSEEFFLNTIINSVVQYAEWYMDRNLITRTLRTYRDCFDPIIELRRQGTPTITSFKYYNTNGTLINLPLPSPSNTLYYVTDEVYPQLIPYPQQLWPIDVRPIAQAVIIEFQSGFGPQKTDVPSIIREALLNHAAFLYANRGDSDVAWKEDKGASVSSDISTNIPVPNTTKLIYNAYKVLNIIGDTIFQSSYMY